MENKEFKGEGVEQPNAPPNSALDGETVYEVRELPDVFAHKVKEIGVRGNYNASANVFAHDLAPGEKVIKEVDVFIPRSRMTCYELLLCIVTCGIYYLLMLYSKYCGVRILYADRCRMALTNSGRILRWKSDIRGTQQAGCCCVRGSRAFSSVAQISSFNIRKLAAVQRTYSKTQMICGCVGTDHHFGTLLFMFDRYVPQNRFSFLNQLKGFGALPSSVECEPLRTTAGRWWDFAFARPTFAAQHPKFVANPCDPAFLKMSLGHLGKLTGPLNRISTNLFDLFHNSVALASGAWDNTSSQVLELVMVGSHAHQELVDFETAVLGFTQLPDRNHNCLVGKVQDRNTFPMQDGKGPLLTSDDKPRVNVNAKYLNLLDGEEVVDVFPNKPVWTFEQIILTILTFSLYYWFVVTYVHRIKSALILTRKRLFEVHLNKADPADFDAFAAEDPALPTFQLSVRQWHFGKLSQGYVEFNGDVVWGHFKTRWGGLRVYPQVDYTNCCVPICFGLLPEDVVCMRRFLMNFSQTPETSAVDSSRLNLNPVDEGEWVLQDLVQLQANEKPVYVLKGVDDWGCCHKVLRMCSCGTGPVQTFQQILITNTKLWAGAKAENAPWCFQDNILCCGVKYNVVYWKSLVDVRGWRSTSDVMMEETLCSRIFSCLPCCLPFAADQSIEIATTKGFPVIVQQVRTTEFALACGSDADKKLYGLAANDDVLKFREVMANALASANNVKNKPDIKIELTVPL